MKGIKLGIIAICLALEGIAVGTGNFFSYLLGGIGVVIALIAYFVKDNPADKTPPDCA